MTAINSHKILAIYYGDDNHIEYGPQRKGALMMKQSNAMQLLP